jgi:hypothetical protein
LIDATAGGRHGAGFASMIDLPLQVVLVVIVARLISPGGS